MTPEFADRTPVVQTDNSAVYETAQQRGFAIDTMICLGCGDPVVTLPADGEALVPSPLTVLKPCGHCNPDVPESVVPRTVDELDEYAGERVTATTSERVIKRARSRFAEAHIGTPIDWDDSDDVDASDHGDAEPVSSVDPPSEPVISLPSEGTLLRRVLEYIDSEGPVTRSAVVDAIDEGKEQSLATAPSTLKQCNLVVVANTVGSLKTYETPAAVSDALATED